MQPHFTAEIHLLPTDAGGRASALVSGEWRSVLGLDSGHWSARLAFEEQPQPGETFLARVQMLVPGAASLFPVGTTFTVWEGGTKGTGRVVATAL